MIDYLYITHIIQTIICSPYYKNETEQLLELGCKDKNWIDSGGKAKRYEWIASGYLLEKRVCIGKNYQKYFAPQDENTLVHTTIECQKVRDVDAKKEKVSFDLLLTLRWHDPNIVTKFTEKDRREGGITLRPENIDKIWTPDLYIWNRTSVKKVDEWAFLKTSKILPTNDTSEDDCQSCCRGLNQHTCIRRAPA